MNNYYNQHKLKYSLELKKEAVSFVEKNCKEKNIFSTASKKFNISKTVLKKAFCSAHPEGLIGYKNRLGWTNEIVEFIRKNIDQPKVTVMAAKKFGISSSWASIIYRRNTGELIGRAKKPTMTMKKAIEISDYVKANAHVWGALDIAAAHFGISKGGVTYAFRRVNGTSLVYYRGANKIKPKKAAK